MPDKKGRFTEQEVAFVEHYARTGDKAGAARKAGYRSTVQGYQKAASPEIIAAVEARRLEFLTKEAMPLAMQAHLELLQPGTPAAVRRAAVQMTYDEFGKARGDRGEGKDPAEMSSDELASEIRKLEMVAAAKAVDVTPTEETKEEQSLFE